MVTSGSAYIALAYLNSAHNTGFNLVSHKCKECIKNKK